MTSHLGDAPLSVLTICVFEVVSVPDIFPFLSFTDGRSYLGIVSVIAVAPLTIVATLYVSGTISHLKVLDHNNVPPRTDLQTLISA